jgi:nitrile hydratase beta subunit
MNGGHDLGGMHGLGPIAPETDEPLFHAPWERRAFAITLAMGAHGRWTLDRSRFAREDRHPVDYLGSSYYELWVKALERLAGEEGFLAADEIATGHALHPPPAHARRALAADDVPRLLTRGGPSARPLATAPRFAVGEQVRVRVMTPTGHCRAPRYCRGHVGRIESWHGGHVFPDSNAAGRGEDPQHLYTLRFAARTLWGPEASARDSVAVDLWEPYLEAVA